MAKLRPLGITNSCHQLELSVTIVHLKVLCNVDRKRSLNLSKVTPTPLGLIAA